MTANEKNFPGRPINRSAKVWNKLVDAANRPQDRKANRFDDARGTDVVLVRNDSGSDLAQGSVVGLIDKALGEIDPSHLWFKAHTIDQQGLLGHQLRGYGVLLEALKHEATEASRTFHRCQMSGVCMALVTVGDVDHWGAKVVDGQTSFQSCSGTGIHATILAKANPAGTGLMACWVLLLTQRCLPPQLIRNVRATETGLVRDVWWSYAPCDEYVPYTFAEFTDCYVPYTPYVPTSTSTYFADDFVLGEHPEWAIPSPWQTGSPGYDDDMALHVAWDDTPTDPATLTVEIGEEGGFFQFRYYTQDEAFDVTVNGSPVYSSVGTGLGSWLLQGPFALDPGTNVIEFTVTSGSAGGVIAIDDITVWGLV